jgi:hypothetical protein
MVTVSYLAVVDRADAEGCVARLPDFQDLRVAAADLDALPGAAITAVRKTIAARGYAPPPGTHADVLRTRATLRVPVELDGPPRPAWLSPFKLRGTTLPNRAAVSPMAQYMAHDGMPGDWHMVHLGNLALGGAGLVIVEMTCVSPEARITPGCPGLWSDAHGAAWRRITDFIHA